MPTSCCCCQQPGMGITINCSQCVGQCIDSPTIWIRIPLIILPYVYPKINIANVKRNQRRTTTIFEFLPSTFSSQRSIFHLQPSVFDVLSFLFIFRLSSFDVCFFPFFFSFYFKLYDVKSPDLCKNCIRCTWSKPPTRGLV